MDINDTNAKLQIKNKLKIVNVARLKKFVEEAPNRSSESDQRLSQGDPGLVQDQQDQPPHRPMTRAFKRLTDLKNAATMAISLLSNIQTEECYGNIFDANFDKYHCKNCYNGITTFLSLPNLKQIFKKACDNSICSTTPQNNAAQENLITNAAQENLINNNADPNISNVFTAKFNQTEADQSEILAIKAELRGALLSVASKLLKSDDTRLHQLSQAEQELWNSFEKADIYEFLTGEKDTIPPVAPPIAAPPPVPVAPPPVAPPAPVDAQPEQEPLPELLPPQPPQPQPGGSDRQLRHRQPIDYKELNTGIKQRCRSLRRKAKAVVTKLAPGALSPQSAAPSHEKT